MGHGHSKDDARAPAKRTQKQQSHQQHHSHHNQQQQQQRQAPADRRHSAREPGGHEKRAKDRTPAAAMPQPEAARPRAASTSTPASNASQLNDRVALRGRNLFCTLLDNRDEQAERKQADDRRSVARMGRGYRVPRAFIDRFEWGELVGSGAYSYVQKAVDKRTGMKVAIKCVRKDPLDQDLCDQIETEVELQCEVCKHENIVTIVEFINTPSMYFIVMELLEGDLLRTIVTETRAGKYSEQKAAATIRGMASALNACHQANIAHLDIKPDNVLFSEDGVLKLADFGMAAKVPVYRDVGTPLFVAPEILLEGECDTKADIFSLGVVSYILLCGFAPWVEARTLDDLSHAIKTNRWDFYSPYWDTISDEAKDLVASMMDPDPRRRPTAVQVIEHPWIVSASAKPFNRAVPRRIISHARHEFVKRASRVHKFQKKKAAAKKLRAGTREAMKMASTAPLTKRQREQAAAADTGVAAQVDEADATVSPASANSANMSARLDRTPAAVTITPKIVSRSAKISTKSSLRGRTSSSSRGRVSFSAHVVEVDSNAEKQTRGVRFGDDDAGAGGAGAGAGAGDGAAVDKHRLTAGDRAAMRARREEDRRNRQAADRSRWERLRETSAHLVAMRVQELDEAVIDDFD